MNHPIVRKLLAILLGILILLYVVYQVFISVYVAVETETVAQSTLADVYETQAYIVRNEEVITGDTGGYVVDYVVEDGGKVSKGGTVAELYATSTAIGIQDQINRLETEITLLQRLSNSSDSYAADPIALGQLAGNNIASLLTAVTAGDFSDEASMRLDILFRLNQLAIVTDDSFDYTARLTQLQAELSSLKASEDGAVGSITTSSSGFFSRTVDGYESAFAYDNIEKISVEDIQQNIQPAAIPANAVGKIAINHEWYIVCIMDAESVLKLSDLKSVRVTLPFVSSLSVEAEIAAVNQTSYQSDAAVVLRCSSIDSALINARYETIQIELNAYTGVLVRQDAIRFADVTETIQNDDGTTTEVIHENVKGVYILVGNRLEFVQIFTVVSANGYVVCKAEPGVNDALYTDHTIRLYDKVVVKGRDLYDGKVL